jgi:hypothetical protein
VRLGSVKGTDHVPAHITYHQLGRRWRHTYHRQRERTAHAHARAHVHSTRRTPLTRGDVQGDVLGHDSLLQAAHSWVRTTAAEQPRGLDDVVAQLRQQYNIPTARGWGAGVSLCLCGYQQSRQTAPPATLQPATPQWRFM